MKKVGVILALIAAAAVAVALVWSIQSRFKGVSGSVSKQNTAPAIVVSSSPEARPGYVTDSANVIDQLSRTQLEETLAALKQRRKIDFAVVTVQTTGNQSAKEYSLALARERQHLLGENNNGGLLLLVAVEDRDWHIQVTRNLEEQLTNEILTSLSPPMTDSFREKKYGVGIIKYVNAVIQKQAARHSSP